MDNTSKIICRKCGGNHLSIKCGKTGNNIDLKTEVDDNIEKKDKKIFIKRDDGDSEKKPYVKREGGDGEKKPYFKREGTDGDSEKKPYFNREGNDGERRQVNKVRIGSLPLDMTEEELNELLYDWGTVKHLKVLQYPAHGSSTAYVEFRYADEVDYLVKALDRTPMDHRVISVEKLDN